MRSLMLQNYFPLVSDKLYYTETVEFKNQMMYLRKFKVGQLKLQCVI